MIYRYAVENISHIIHSKPIFTVLCHRNWMWRNPPPQQYVPAVPQPMGVQPPRSLQPPVDEYPPWGGHWNTGQPLTTEQHWINGEPRTWLQYTGGQPPMAYQQYRGSPPTGGQVQTVRTFRPPGSDWQTTGSSPTAEQVQTSDLREGGQPPAESRVLEHKAGCPQRSLEEADKHRRESLNRRYNEKHQLLENKDPGYRRFRNKHEHIHRYCGTCSEFTSKLTNKYMKIVTHTHFSSFKYRTTAPVDSDGNYTCITCESTPHSCKVGMRYAVLLSSSTLHQWQGRRERNRYRGNELHMEECTIPGASIDDLTHALLAEFSGTYRPIDVIAVCGLNDVLRGRTPDQIISSFRKLQEAVHHLTPEGERNSIGIATMIIPPKIAHLRERQWGPTPGSNLYNMVEINARILCLNQEQEQGQLPVMFAPRFHTWGMTGKSRGSRWPRNLLEGIQYHRSSQWRESARTRRLHLSDDCRLRMGRTCIGYFKALYKITPCLAASKIEGLRLEKEKREKEGRKADRRGNGERRWFHKH